MADLNKYVQMQPKQLGGAGAILGATTVIIKDFTGIDGVELTMSDFGDKGFATLEPGSGTQEEQISFTGVTQNGNGTATLTGVKTVLFISPYTEVSGLAKTHAGGTVFVISNTAGFYDRLASKYNDETITGIWTFTDPNVPRMDIQPVYGAGTELYFATKQYVDDTAFAGAPDASTSQKGIVQEATVAQINSDTYVGSTLARLFTNPGVLSLSKYGLQLPSADEKSALGGSAGNPNSLNKYLTQDDATNFGGSVTQALQNSIQPVGEADSTTRSNRICQTFIATNSSIIQLYLNKQTNTGTNAGNVIIEFFAVDGSNNPTGSALATTTVLAATWNALSNGVNYFTLSYTFTIGTTYALVVRQSTADNANHINLGYQNTNVYANGTLKKFNTTDGWSSVTGDLTFALFISTSNTIVRRNSTGGIYIPGSPTAATDATPKSYVDGLTLGEKLYLAAANTQYGASSTSEVDMISVTVPGGTLSTNNGLRIRIETDGFFASTGSATIRIKYGATTITSIASLTPGSAINGYIDATIYANAATNAQRGFLQIFFGNNITGASTSAFHLQNCVTGTAAEDSTANQTLAVTIQYTSSDVNNYLRVCTASVVKIR